MALASQTVVSNGSLTALTLGIDYLAQSDITVTYDGVANTTNWAWASPTSNQIIFTPAVPVNTVVTLKRTTSAIANTHKYVSGAVFNSVSMDSNFKQLLLIAQENRERGTTAVPWETTGTTAQSVTSQPAGTLNSTTVQAALNELDTEKLAASQLSGPTGSETVGFAYATAYTVGSIGRWLKDLALSAGASLIGFIQSGIGAVTRSVQSKLRDVLCVKDFGAVGDGVTDDTAAIQAAVVAAEANRNNEIHFPVGNYIIAGTVTLKGGIHLKGSGAMGAQVAGGVVLTHNANSVNMLVWDGSHVASASGIGGGISNIQCVKGAGFSGGDAIKLVATGDSYRPGEFTVENVLVWKGNGGVWSRGFHVDGTVANTPGSKGIRSIRINKLRVGDCSVNNQYVYLNQAVHVISEYLQIDTGSGTGTCGMTIDNDSDNIILNGLILNGNLIINGSSNMNVTLAGRVSTLDVNNTGVLGAANIQSTAITNASTYFRIVSNITDSFKVTRTSTLSSVTGDGTSYKVPFDDEVFDTCSSFVTDTFTAKCAGRYLFTWCVGYNGILVGHTRHDTSLDQFRSGSTISSHALVSNPYAGSAGGSYSVPGSTELLLLEGDTVSLTAQVSGSTKTIAILGASTQYTWFSGQYLP